MLILGLLAMYFDAAVVFVMKSSLLFRLAVAILCIVTIFFNLKIQKRIVVATIIGGNMVIGYFLSLSWDRLVTTPVNKKS